MKVTNVTEEIKRDKKVLKLCELVGEETALWQQGKSEKGSEESCPEES